MINVFKRCYSKSDWRFDPPRANEIWIDEYLDKRGWTGHIMWIDPLVSTNFLPDEDNPCEDIQNTVRGWMSHYGVRVLEDAVVIWCHEHCTGRWDRFLLYGVEFEKEEDAVLFKFSWCT